LLRQQGTIWQGNERKLGMLENGDLKDGWAQKGWRVEGGGNAEF
jgi:hypothetical protein